MVSSVIYDLKVFLLFYVILMIMFGMIFAVIGVNNFEIPGGAKDYSDMIAQHNLDYDDMLTTNGGEYSTIGFFFAGIIYTLRTSIGDFDFDMVCFLNPDE